MKRSIRFGLNGRDITLNTDVERTLLWVLRTDLALTGTKYGCGQGFCGACTVIVEGKAVRSCLTLLKDIAGKDVLTVKASPVTAKCTPCSKHLSTTVRFSAVIALLECCFALRRFCATRQSRRATRSSPTWKATCAAAELIKGSLPQLNLRPSA
ncbi:MAG: 2Fe-2S iron-sulfur cluster-binding protein [Steroidobacteraceae bacterium]